jgi:hypothetical protein
VRLFGVNKIGNLIFWLSLVRIKHHYISEIKNHYEMFNHSFHISVFCFSAVFIFCDCWYGTVRYCISKCVKRMQIRWTASFFKNRYPELSKLEQYKLSGQIMRQQSGSASMFCYTYTSYLVIWRKLWRWYDRTMKPQKGSLYFIFTILICILFSACGVSSGLRIGRTPNIYLHWAQKYLQPILVLSTLPVFNQSC